MLVPSLNCPGPVPRPLPTVPTTPVMLAYSGVTGRCFKMIVCISRGSKPANDASRWRKDEPLEAKASTSACLEYGAVTGVVVALELPPPPTASPAPLPRPDVVAHIQAEAAVDMIIVQLEKPVGEGLSSKSPSAWVVNSSKRSSVNSKHRFMKPVGRGWPDLEPRVRYSSRTSVFDAPKSFL